MDYEMDYEAAHTRTVNIALDINVRNHPLWATIPHAPPAPHQLWARPRI